MKKLFYLILILSFVITSTWLVYDWQKRDAISSVDERESIDNYLSYFYNRYSKHFDDNGMILKTPNYGRNNFTKAETARDLMSIASFYKYRALNGEKLSRQKIANVIREADKKLQARPAQTHSFEDAAAQFLIARLLDQMPDLLYEIEQRKIFMDILERAKLSIQAPDTSNRAALSAVYWQYVINSLYDRGLIDSNYKHELDNLLLNKILQIAQKDINKNGWYKEGVPLKFNPHYHMVTAMAVYVFSELTDTPDLQKLARQMTTNIRKITFVNGQVEASIGERPIGLGAQFYLGAGLLNYAFGYDDFATYFNYAFLDKFFSNSAYPNRLEYHATIKGRTPNFHDDYAFSNLAELALTVPSFASLKFKFTDKMSEIDNVVKDDGLAVLNYGTVIWFDNLRLELGKDEKVIISKVNTTVQQKLTQTNQGAFFRRLIDTDLDGLDDDEELLRATNVNNSDTDNDGLIDGYEVVNGYNPNNPVIGKIAYNDNLQMRDNDRDGLNNYQEILLGTNPDKFDSDNDGYVDSVELDNGTDPLDPANDIVIPVDNLDGVVKGVKIKKVIYGKMRIDPDLEKQEAIDLRQQLVKIIGQDDFDKLELDQWNIFIDAYIYGRFTVDEIVDVIKHGPGAIHTDILAVEWRESEEYQAYLERLLK